MPSSQIIETFSLRWTASGDSIVGETLAQWCTYTGQQEDATQHWGWIEALHPADRERVRQHWRMAVKLKRFYEMTYRLRRVDDTYHAFHVRYLPISNDHGVLCGWQSWLWEDTIERSSTTQESLQQSLYSLMLEQASIGISFGDLGGHFLNANQYLCKMFGYSQQELREYTFQELTHPDDLSVSYNHIYRLLRGEIDIGTYEKRYIRKNGDIIWVKVTMKRLKLPAHTPFIFLLMMEDITQRKQAEEEHARLLGLERMARAAEKRARDEALALAQQLKAVFGAMIDPVIVYDYEGLILQINPAALYLFGHMAEDEVLGKSYECLIQHYEIFDEQHHKLAREEMPMFRVLRGEVITKAQAQDVILSQPSGQELSFSVSGSPMYNSDQQVIGGICVFYDVTVHRQKERQIQRALNALLTAVEELVHLPDPSDLSLEEVLASVLTSHMVGERLAALVRQVLPCKYVGVVAVDPLTQALRLVGTSGITEQEAQQARQEIAQYSLLEHLDARAIARLRANKVVSLKRLDLKRCEQQPLLLRLISGPQLLLLVPMLIDRQLVGFFVVDKHAKDLYSQEEMNSVKAIAKLVVLVIERIRLLKEWEETHANELALQEANRRFDTFLGIASHELRTPLTGIKGNVQLMLRRFEKLSRQYGSAEEVHATYEERLRHPLEDVLPRVLALERMVSELLDASRVHADRLDIIVRSCNLAEIVHDAVKDAHHAAPDRLIQVRSTLAGAIPILADADRIRQVMDNYLTNALKYSAIPYPVNVYLDSMGANVRVGVEDAGPGIPVEEQERVWQRFHRVRGVEVQYGSGSGLGLGLYLCRTIVERHNGQVGLSSEPGKGSTFWFSLPLAPA